MVEKAISSTWKAEKREVRCQPCWKWQLGRIARGLEVIQRDFVNRNIFLQRAFRKASAYLVVLPT